MEQLAPSEAGSSAAAAPQPAAIHALPEAVVHRIAAGEVVQRPASALKEMLENSLDAGARHVVVTAKEGGLRFLQVQDDGCGIRLEDLPILCHRHTTSKLRAFEDLETISTLGFRGEALASISYVAHVSVTTMPAGQPHGHRAAYADGQLLPPGAKPVAAVPGTAITVEDMFFNMPARRKAFRPGPEEHNLLLDVLQRYAVHKAGAVGFTLKRQGEARSDLHTLPTTPRRDVIRSLYGPDLAAGLLPLSVSGGRGDVSAAVPLDGPMAFSASGFISALTYTGRRSVLVLFINGRPVEQSQLKRAIEAAYTAHNPKASKPWVYLDLRLPPRHVEVNVHPTKREVGFLHQAAIIDAISAAVEAALAASMNSRSFAVNRPTALAAAAAPAARAAGAAGGSPQQVGDGGGGDDADGGSGGGGGGGGEAAPAVRAGSATARGGGGGGGSQARPGSGASSQPSYYRPEKLVRTDHRTQTLDGFLVSQASAAAVASAAAAGGGGPARRRRSAAGPGGSQAPALEDGGGDGFAGGGFSNASLHLQAAAAEEAAAAAELDAAQRGDAGGGARDQAGAGEAQQAPLLRPLAQPRLPPVVTQLSSVHELLADVQAGMHAELEQLFKCHTWVGMADERLALLQHGTRLYLADLGAISSDLFYQLLLTRWEAPRVMALRQPLHVGRLMGLALEHEQAAGRWRPEPGSTREELCELVQSLLAQKAEMLAEYVGLTFKQCGGQQQQQQPDQEQQQQPGQQQQQQQPDEPQADQRADQQQPHQAAQEQQQQQPNQPQADQQPDQQPCQQEPDQQQPGLYLTGLPLLLDGYVPDLAALPQLVLALARDVDWDSEKPCFRSLATALAAFHELQPLLPPPPAPEPEQAAAEGGGAAPGHAGADGSDGSGPQPMELDDAAGAAAAAGPPAEACTTPRERPRSAAAAGSAAGVLAAHRGAAQREWVLRHVLMPALKGMYRPPAQRARDGSVLLLTSMERLYRVFERCGW